MEELLQSTEKEELIIDTIDGLANFLRYTKDAYADFSDTAELYSMEEREPFVQRATAAFEKIETLVERYTKVLDYGGFLSEDDVEDIQSLYNEIVTAQDELTGEVTDEEEPSNEAPVDMDSIEEATVTPSSSEDYSEDVVSVVEGEDAFGWSTSPSVIEINKVQIVDESESGTDVRIKQTRFDSEAFWVTEKETIRRAESLLSLGEAKLHEYQALSEIEDTTDDIKNGLELFHQLKNHVREVREIFSQLQASLRTPVSDEREQFLVEAQQTLLAFETQLPLIDKGLGWFFESTQAVLASQQVVESAHEVPLAANDNKIEFRPNLFSKNEMKPFIEAIITVPEYKEFLSSYFKSPGAFEAYLRREILEREKPSKFDTVFGFERKSAFDTLLSTMTLKEADAFDGQQFSLRDKVLRDKDIESKVYDDWMREYAAMKEWLKPQSTITFGELFVLDAVERLMNLSEKKVA